MSNQIGLKVKARIQELDLTNSLICGRIAIETNAAWNPDPLEITHIIRGRRGVLTTELAVLAIVLECRASELLGES